MSFNDEYSAKSSQWSPLSQSEDDEDDGNAPTQPLPRVRVSARPIAPVPAFPQQKAPVKEQSAWSAPVQIPVEVNQIPTKPLQPAQPLRPAAPLASVAAPRRTKKRRMALPVAIVLVVLAVLLVLGGVLAHFLTTSGATAQGQPPVLPTGHTGAFAGVPLNPHQVNQLQHLASNMQYKQLASMYVQTDESRRGNRPAYHGGV